VRSAPSTRENIRTVASEAVVVATIPPAALRPPTLWTVTGSEGDRKLAGVPVPITVTAPDVTSSSAAHAGQRRPPPRVGTRCQDDVVTGCSITDLFALVDQLPGVTRVDNGRYWRIAVSNRTFGYLWEPTLTVGLKQTIAEQLALVAERPETFEVQFTSGGFGWVVARLGGIERDELAELIFEAWRLTAPAALIGRRGEQLPR
jgi:hypothetical protein